MLLGILHQKTLLMGVCNIITLVFVRLILYVVVQFFYPMQLAFQKIGPFFLNLFIKQHTPLHSNITRCT